MKFFKLLGLLLIGVSMSHNADSGKCDEISNTCAVISCGMHSSSGTPGRDGRDGKEGPKGEKGERGLQGNRGSQGAPGKLGPPGIKGDKGSVGEKGDPGRSATSEVEEVKTQIKTLEGQLHMFHAELNKYAKILLFHGGKQADKKVFVTNGHEENFENAQRTCKEAGGNIATPLSAAENSATQEVLQTKGENAKAFLGISDLQVEGIFKYVGGDKISYTNWNLGEPNNSKDSEDCVETQDNGKWNDIPCSLLRLEFANLRVNFQNVGIHRALFQHWCKLNQNSCKLPRAIKVYGVGKFTKALVTYRLGIQPMMYYILPRRGVFDFYEFGNSYQYD